PEAPPSPAAPSAPEAAAAPPAPEAAAPPALEAVPAAPPPAPAPPPPRNKREEAKGKLHDLITRHGLNVVAIGNGTACRETEACVNQVGVDVNTASVPLLRHVSGLNQMVARDLVEYRKQHGPFRTREQLLQVPNIGPARYTQAAGFLKIAGDNPLDRTWIHP